MKQLLIILLMGTVWSVFGQELPSKKENKRLDFARTYFELGGNYSPAFTGKRATPDEVLSFQNSASFSPYLNWGGFHFWGHAEFYVTFPLHQLNLNTNKETDHELRHYVVTGARYLPWAYQEKKLRPYVGLSWSSQDFKQIVSSEIDHPIQTKEFMWVPDMGMLYGVGNITARLGVNYFHDNTWQYPITATTFEEIRTPSFNLQFGVIYSFESTKPKRSSQEEEWNNYPTVSRLGLDAKRSGDFFIGIGPSSSFSLKGSAYTTEKFPFLNSQLSSENYFDIAAGYQFNKAGIFAALSFRNPIFKTSGYGIEQQVKKTSIAFEVNKYLVDYTGFVPYIGLNLAYDHLKYSEITNGQTLATSSNQIEPGVTFGWDILPGKTSEFLILRTNLRWYPFSSFEVEQTKFDFSQLEYNLIQVVFYPGRYF